MSLIVTSGRVNDRHQTLLYPLIGSSLAWWKRGRKMGIGQTRGVQVPTWHRRAEAAASAEAPKESER
jgi:hypothetical protein